MLDLHVKLTKTATTICWDQLTLTIYLHQPTELPSAPALILQTQQQQITQVGYWPQSNQPLPSAPFILLTDADWPEALPALGLLLVEQTPTLLATNLGTKVPTNYRQPLQPTVAALNLILARFGFAWQPPKATKTTGKTRHRWTKAISTVPFKIDTRQATGTVLWQKRNELLLKAGATLMPSAPLNQDGTLGFAAKMGTQLRSEHQTAISNHQTTVDLIFKSVNEIGLFLYFGGTNSWLELHDAHQRTIDDWTKI